MQIKMVIVNFPNVEMRYFSISIMAAAVILEIKTSWVVRTMNHDD